MRVLRPALAAVCDAHPPRGNRLKRTVEVFDREIDRLWEGHELAWRRREFGAGTRWPRPRGRALVSAPQELDRHGLEGNRPSDLAVSAGRA